MTTADARPAASSAGVMLLAGWFAYLLIAPAWGFYWIDAWHNEQRAVEVILLAGTALLAAAVARFRAALVPRSSTAFLFCAVVLLGALSSLRAAFVAPAFAELSLYVLLAVLAIVTAATVRQDPARFCTWATRACALLALIHVTGIAARYAAMIGLERAPNHELLLLGYANPRFPTALYALLMPFVAMFALDVRERLAARRVAWVVLVLLWCINIALGTRAIWFAYALALPLLAWFAGWRRLLPAARVLAVTALAGLVVYYVLFVGVPGWLGLGSALPSHIQHLTSVNDRLHLWSQGLQVMSDRPLLGIGPMNLAGLGDSYASHPHNWVLQVGAEWGMPALVLLLWGLWRLGGELRARLRADTFDATNVLAPLAATAIGFCYGLVDGNLVMPVSQALFALILGVLLGSFLPVRSGGAPARPALSAAVAAVLLASGAFLLVHTLDTLARQAENEASWRRVSKHPDLAPRFWQQGLLR